MKIGGANAPPTNNKRPRKYGFGCVFAALVWPDGHTQLAGSPGLVNIPYLLLVFLFPLQKLTKQPVIVWLQPLNSGRILLNLLICKDFALIS